MLELVLMSCTPLQKENWFRLVRVRFSFTQVSKHLTLVSRHYLKRPWVDPDHSACKGKIPPGESWFTVFGRNLHDRTSSRRVTPHKPFVNGRRAFDLPLDSTKWVPTVDSYGTKTFSLFSSGKRRLEWQVGCVESVGSTLGSSYSGRPYTSYTGKGDRREPELEFGPKPGASHETI